MKSFFYKAFIALCVTVYAQNINAADNTNSLLEDLQQAAGKPATLSFTPMVFDFSTELSTTASIALCVGQLITAESAGTLNSLQLPYLISEAFAGYVRAKPDSCLDFASHARDSTAMYTAWGKAFAAIKVAENELSALSNFTTAAPFVHGVVVNDMPAILKALGVTDSKLSDVNVLLQTLEPVITPTLCLAYASAKGAAAAGEAHCTAN